MPLIAVVKPVEGVLESRLVNIRQWVADSFPQATEIEQVQVGYITFGFFSIHIFSLDYYDFYVLAVDHLVHALFHQINLMNHYFYKETIDYDSSKYFVKPSLNIPTLKLLTVALSFGLVFGLLMLNILLSRWNENASINNTFGIFFIL
jgi:hypothetical protein